MFDKYNSVPFQVFFSKSNGHQVKLDYANRLLVIRDENNTTTAIVHFSNSITHEINMDELLNQSVEKKKKAYYVYENGTHGNNWLWYYGDLMSIADLLF